MAASEELDLRNCTNWSILVRFSLVIYKAEILLYKPWRTKGIFSI